MLNVASDFGLAASGRPEPGAWSLESKACETDHPDRRRRARRPDGAHRRAPRRGVCRRGGADRRSLSRSAHARPGRSDRPRRVAARHGRPGHARAPARAAGGRAGRADLGTRQHRIGGPRHQAGRLRFRGEAAVAREDRAGRAQRAASAPARDGESRASRPRRSPRDDGRRELRRSGSSASRSPWPRRPTAVS